MPLPNPLTLTHTPDNTISWVNVKAIGEVTARNTFHRNLKNTIDAKSFILFLTQHDRNFVPTLSFFGDHFLLTITDRESQQFTRILSLRDERPEDVLLFMRILVGLMFCPDHVLGLDTTMVRNKKHEIDSIMVEGKAYKVVKLLYSVQSLLGRGTKVWQVEYDKKYYILKDSWVIASRPLESDVLKALKGTEGIPTIIAGGAVEHPELSNNGPAPVPLRTSLFRFSRWAKHPNARERRRVVEDPHAAPLSTFKSRLEVCVAFRDYTRGEYKFNRKYG